MELFRWDIVIEIVAIVSSGIGVYAAIRSDLAVMHAKQEYLKEEVDEVKTDFKAHVNNAHCHQRSNDS